MLKRIEDITVISGEEFLSYEGEYIFVDTHCPFQSQPLTQAFISFGEAEDQLPTIWHESSVFSGEVFMTFEAPTLHTFLSLSLQEQITAEQFVFVKVIAIGDAQELKAIRRV
jgi:hypothetical protein